MGLFCKIIFFGGEKESTSSNLPIVATLRMEHLAGLIRR